MSQTLDLWNAHDFIMASENLLDGTISAQWHGASSGNHTDEIQLEFIDPIKLKSMKSWFSTYTNLNDASSGMNIEGSYDGTNFVRILTNGARRSAYNNQNAIDQDINLVETQIPAGSQGYYKYYNFKLLDGGRNWSRCGEIALYGEYNSTIHYNFGMRYDTETIQATFGNNYWGAPSRDGSIKLYAGRTYIFDWSNANVNDTFNIFTTTESGGKGPAFTDNVTRDTTAKTLTLIVTGSTPTQLRYGGDGWGSPPNGIITVLSGMSPYVPTNALYSMFSSNIMVSTQSSADATSSGWSRQNMHFQTASNNYSRVDFITSGSRFCVGLVKENLSAVSKTLLTSKPHFGNGNTTHWQLHSNAVNIFSETGYDSWNNHGGYQLAMNKVCSVISTDYWEENLFGNGADLPANFGHVDISPQSGVHQDWTPTQWALDDDGNIILTVITNSWPLDNLTHYSKITKYGEYVDGSAKIKYPETTFSSQADLINGYNGADSYNPAGGSNAFTKGTDYPQSTIKYIVDGTLVRTITHNGPPGGYYIAALINGPGQIEFLPNPYMYFDCIRVPKILNTDTLVAYGSDMARMNNSDLDKYISYDGGYILTTNSSSNPNHKKYSSTHSINSNHDLRTMYAFNHYTINFNTTLTQSEGYCIAVWVYHTASRPNFYYGDEILQGSPGRMHINNSNKFMSSDLIDVNSYYLFVVSLEPGSSTYKYYYGQYDANMNPVGKLKKSATTEGAQYTTFDRTNMATYNTAHNTDTCYYLESMAFKGNFNYDSINNNLYYRLFKYGTGNTNY